MQATPTNSDLAERFTQNPILEPGDIRPSIPGMKVECLLNPGVFQFEGRTWLLLRVAERPEQTSSKTSFPVLEDGKVKILEFNNDDPRLDRSDPRVVKFDGADYLTTLSHLRLVSSEDGIHFREESSFPLLTGNGPMETYGIEDCRVARIGSSYYLTYTQVSPSGVGVGLRSTQDWREITERGMIFPPHNKDCALFEELIDGKYYALHRPSSPELGGNYIWLAESPDLLHWGGHRCIGKTRGGMWDSVRIGAGGPPIRTSKGWLEIYHGADAFNRYCLGALLLDLKEPWKVLARSQNPIMEPAAEYECNGFFGSVVFSNGHVVDGDQITIYYGASDSVICGARLSIAAILATL
ncbi:MAG: glycoside hydrolase family 130 protein [Chthoniobacteraceae bacterium]